MLGVNFMFCKVCEDSAIDSLACVCEGCLAHYYDPDDDDGGLEDEFECIRLNIASGEDCFA